MKFESFKNARIVRSSWLDEGGRRLDCGPYMSGALEARDILKNLKARKDTLKSLTAGHNGGIYNGPMFRRNYVDSPEYGVPFITSGSMLLADLSTLPLLRKKDAQSSRLSYLKLKAGTTLISCSGTIGRMTYVRPDMADMWSSQDVLKVVPDEAKIPPGYLYAFLSSKFGVPLVVSGTYGAIIQHIEAEHIAEKVTVPRFGAYLENRVHELITKAAGKRDQANRVLQGAIAELIDLLKLQPLSPAPSTTPFSITVASSSEVQSRLDAFFYSTYHRQAVAALDGCNEEIRLLKNAVISIEEPNRFKRIVLNDDSEGTPLFGTSAIFWNDPEPSYHIPSKSAAPCIVSRKTLLIPRSGQLSGVIGKVVLPYGRIIGGAVSEDAIRIHCHTESDAGFLFVFLSSEYGVRQLKARAFGTSIPHLDVRQISNCLVLSRSHPLWESLGDKGLMVSMLRGEAIEMEDSAKRIVEYAIESDNT
jgi:type I restriction enzyme S subunit